MRDRRELAVFPGPQLNALDRCRAVRGVVDNQRPLQRHLDRALELARGQSGDHHIGTNEQFATETAADERGVDAYVFLRHAKRLGERDFAPLDHLVGHPHSDLIAVPRCDGRVWLHHGVRFVGRGVGGIELHGSGGVCAVEVAVAFHAGLAIATFDQRCVGGKFGEVEIALLPLVFDDDHVRGRAGLFEGLGHDHRDGLVVVLDFRTAKQVRGVLRTERRRLEVERVEHTDDARSLLCMGDVHRLDAPLGDACAQHIAIGLPWDHIVPLIGVRRRAGGL